MSLLPEIAGIKRFSEILANPHYVCELLLSLPKGEHDRLVGKMFRRKATSEITDTSDRQLYEQTARDQFPRPVPLDGSGKSVAFRGVELALWIAWRAACRDYGAPALPRDEIEGKFTKADGTYTKKERVRLEREAGK